MEGDNMRHAMIYLMVAFFLQFEAILASDRSALKSEPQKGSDSTVSVSKKSEDNVDRFRLHFEISNSLTQYKLMGVTDNGNHNKTIIQNHEVVSEPEYGYDEVRIFSYNLYMNLGINIPVYRNENWSTGFKSTIGLGAQAGIGAEDFTSMIFDGAQFVYFRNYKSDFDYSIFSGVKYTVAPISYGLFLVGFDYNISNRSAVRFFVSPIRRTYYNELTNGDLKPAIRITELGVGFVF
jgi:hypothetical protein